MLPLSPLLCPLRVTTPQDWLRKELQLHRDEGKWGDTCELEEFTAKSCSTQTQCFIQERRSYGVPWHWESAKRKGDRTGVRFVTIRL